MKKFFPVMLFSLLVLSCETAGETSASQNRVLTTEKKPIILTNMLAEGASASDRRPMDGIMSEREVLLRVSEIASRKNAPVGAHYVYEELRRFRTVKIETPILVHSPEGLPISYRLIAVNDRGGRLFTATVRPGVTASDDDLVQLRTISIHSYNYVHTITKRELKEYAQKRFPGMIISEPIMLAGIYTEGSRLSNGAEFWYFTTGSAAPGSPPVIDEYLMDATVGRYTPSTPIAINPGYRGSPHLGGFRLAKLTTPLNLKYDSSARYMEKPSGPRPNPVMFEGVPLE